MLSNDLDVKLMAVFGLQQKLMSLTDIFNFVEKILFLSSCDTDSDKFTTGKTLLAPQMM